MLMNCPSLRAAPRSCVNLDTRRLIFPSVNIRDGEVVSPEDVERRSSSEAAP